MELLVGCKEKKIKIIDLKTKNIIGNLIGHTNLVITGKIINHCLFGDFLISQGAYQDQIKIWKINKYFNK